MKKLLIAGVITYSLILFSCSFEESIADEPSEIIQLEIASSKAKIHPEPDAYWARPKGEFTWSLFKQKIEGFNYNSGFEYSISAEKKGNNYRLISIDNKEKKHSVVPQFFTSDKNPNEDNIQGFSPKWVSADGHKDSFYFYQGDVILTKRQYEKVNGTTRSLKTYNDPNHHYWTNKKIYYVFDSGFTHQAKVLAAMQKWEEKTLLKFVQGTGNGDYIRFINDDSDPHITGYSYLGCVGGMQILALGNASTTGTAIHEIGHALGLGHEHCRNDRDNYITILWNNISSDLWPQFYISPYTLDIGSFDFSSIMLYSSWQGGSPSMRTINGYTFSNQNSYISDGDSAGIASIPTYGPPLCELTCDEVTTYYDVSGSVEERVFEDTYTINLYSDRYKQIPYTLTSPKTVKMVTEHEYWNPSTYQLQVDKTTWNFVIPAGVSSYTFDTIENRFYYFNSEPAYGYSIKTYELVDQ